MKTSAISKHLAVELSMGSGNEIVVYQSDVVMRLEAAVGG